MKNFCAKIVVNIKPTIKDIKGLTLKQAVENLITVENLSCSVGSIYTLNFSANDKTQAQEITEKIAQEILSNEVIETYQITLEEVHE